MWYYKNTSQSGRSLTEMLGVLAIMSVLSLVSLAIFQSLMNKHKANTIVHDSRMAWMEVKARQFVTDSQWLDISTSFESGKTFQMMRDKKGNDYIKVKGVEKTICKHILNMAVSNVLTFFNEDYMPMTACNENNDIVVAMDELGKPAECITRAECGENFEGICTPEGYCHTCDEASERLNEDKTACECDPNKSLICTDDEQNSWCCGPGLICDIENKSCKDGGGACQYTFIQGEQSTSANCHYTIRKTNNGGNLPSITMIEDQNAKCQSDEYCYIAYFDQACSSIINRGNVGVAEPEDVYGVCLTRSTNNAQCKERVISLTEDQGCPIGEYCYLKWLGNDCSVPIDAGNITGSMFGVCLNRTSNTAECPI